MIEKIIETDAATLAIRRVADSTRATARAACARLVETLAPNAAHTSRSHSGGWIAVGTSNQLNIGVDIEVARPMERRAAIAEMLRLGQCDLDSFWSRWTLRESLAKCTGGSVLVLNNAEPALAEAAAQHGEWIGAGEFAALCGRLGNDIYYSLVLGPVNRS